jgi:hypothetical protein
MGRSRGSLLVVVIASGMLVFAAVLGLRSLEPAGRRAMEPQSWAEERCQRFEDPSTAETAAWSKCIERELKRPASVSDGFLVAAIVIASGALAGLALLAYHRRTHEVWEVEIDPVRP